MYIHDYSSPLGKIKIISDGEFITDLLFDDEFAGNVDEKKALSVFDEAERWLDIYFSGHAPDFTPKIKISGSDFQQLACNAMLNIPFGQVKTYSEIAGVIAKSSGLPRMSAQAVGGAASRNKICLIIPCHRVIGSNGNLTGYGGGIERKMKLLKLEGVDTSKLFMPKSNKLQ